MPKMQSSESETTLRKPFIEALRKAGAVVIPYVGSTYGIAGTSDVFVAHKDWHGWIEFKGPKTKVEKIQEQFILSMQVRGVNATVVRLFSKNKFQINEMVYTYITGWDIIRSLTSHDLCRRS